MTRVVVTGATGFIGQSLIRRLVQFFDGIDGAPAQIVAISRHPTQLPAELRDRVETHALDLATASPERIAAACGEHALVFHLAANASVASGAEGYRNNVQATQQLIAALRMRPPTRLVYASSIGAVDRHPSDPCTTLLTEDTPPHPLTRYGQGKLEGERLVAASGLPFAIVRPTWVYGPAMRANSHLRVFLDMVRRGSPVTRFRFPGRVSVIHVDDLSAALLLVAQHPKAAGRTFFASDGTPVSIGELFALLGEITGRNAGTREIPRPMVTLARALRPRLPFAAQNLHSDVLAASNSRLRALGFRPAKSLRAGMIELTRATAAGKDTGHWIVTGAASGIGRALAVQLHARGAMVTAVDRDQAGLAALAGECPPMHTLTADLALREQRDTVRAYVEAGTASLTGFVNCAGVGARGAVPAVAVKAQRALLEVNVMALAEFSTVALRRFEAQATGGILVNVASSAAFQPLPFMAAYAASKAFVLHFSEAAAGERRNHKVRIVTVCPGGTDTGFQAAAGVRRVSGERLMPAPLVARDILKAVDRGVSTTLLVSGRTKAMAFIARILPRRMLVHLWGRLMGSLR